MPRLRKTAVVSSPILVALLVCVLLIAVDVLGLRGGNYAPVESSWHVVWTHALFILLLLGFGWYAQVAITRHRAFEQRLAHLNAVLAAVRNVNQIIVREPDRDRLLQGACAAMVEGAGWRSALIMLTGEDDAPPALYQAGLAEETFANLPAWLGAGNVPACAARALDSPGVAVLSEPNVDCGECPLAGKEPEDAIMAARLEHGGRVHGIISVCTTRPMLDDQYEHALLDELAGDLAHALTAISTEEGRKLAEQALRESEARLSSILAAASVGIGATENRVFLEVNHAMCRMTGYSREELVGRSARMVYPTDEDYERTGAEIHQQLAATGSAMVETRWQTKQGAVIDVLVGAMPLAPADPESGITFTALDITEHRRADDALRESEARYRRIVDTANEGIAISDVNLILTFANASLAEMTGYSLEEGVGRSVLEFMDEENAALVRQKMEAWEEGEGRDQYELKLTRKDGSDLWVLNSTSPILDDDGRFAGILVMMADITKRKRAEEALRAREQELAAILHSMVEAVMYLDEDLRISWANDTAERAAGVGKGGLTGRQCCEVLGDWTEECAECPATLALATGQTRHGEMATSDGRVWQMNACPVRDSGGAVIGVVKTMLDITERKRAEELVTRARDFYVTLIDEFPNPIWRAGTDTNCDYFNKAWLEFTGRTLEDEIGEGWAEGVHPDDLDRCVATYLGAFEAREPFFMEYRLRHHTGEYRWLADYGRPMHDVDGRFVGFIGSCYDIQELRQAEEAQRMAALGELAASIAHEFNNLLAIMSGRAQLAQLMGTPEAHEDLIEAVLHATSRAAKISRNLLGFARPSEPERGPVAIEQVVDAALLLAEREFTNTGIEVQREYHTNGALAYADTAQMEQVLLNLIINACHAMTEGGTLTVTTRHVPEEGRPGQVVVAVEDTGRGIRPEHMRRLFDPFFTTKGDDPTGGRPGSGLGLPVSRSIIIAHGGTLEVASEWGAGSTFTANVPAWPGDAVVPDQQPEGALRLPRAETPARVLVADDEETFCEVMARALRQSGHEVARAYTTAAALDAVRANRFDVVVCDLLMPGGGGYALLETVRDLPAKPVVILISGILDQDKARELAAEGADFCLGKPVQLSALLETVQKAVRRAQGGTAE